MPTEPSRTNETPSKVEVVAGSAVPPCAIRRRKRPKRATTKPMPITVSPVRIQASKVRSAAKKTRGSSGPSLIAASSSIGWYGRAEERRKAPPNHVGQRTSEQRVLVRIEVHAVVRARRRRGRG